MTRRVLLVHSSSGHYGADRQLRLIASGLDRSRYEPLVLLPDAGPLAEDEVLGYLEHERYTARVAACKVLKEIGTKKSLKALRGTLAKANREMYGGFRDVAGAARAAINAITARR